MSWAGKSSLNCIFFVKIETGEKNFQTANLLQNLKFVLQIVMASLHFWIQKSMLQRKLILSLT